MDRVVVVTGGSRGIGKAIALEFAKRGEIIAILDLNGEAAEETAKECSTLSGKAAKAYSCQVGDYASCEETVKQIIEELGGIDVLINNAGITRDTLMLRMKEEDFDTVINVNLKGVFNMMKACYSHFMRKKSGKIINMSSVSGIMGNAGQTNYSASKAGVIGLTKSVAKELASRGVCVNAIAPGFIETPMTESFKDRPEILEAIPMGRMGRPEEIAHLAVFLSENDYITGEVIRIDGGMAM